LFVALNLPAAVRRALWEAMTPLRDLDLPVRWVRPEGIHLTLKFLGEVPDETEPDLHAALGRAAHGGGEAHPLPLTVQGFGAFPAADRARVIWAGIDPDPGIELLQHRVEREFEPLGFAPEGRAFRPHVTLGRAERDARPRAFARLAPALAVLHYHETALVETVDLMQSTFQSGGSVYQVRHSERLS
jgi:2'-5' RNA ligase